MRAQANEMEILSLNTPTPADHNQDDYGYFDGVFKVPASLPVPEPSTLSIVVMGTAFLLGRRRKRN